MDHGHDARCRAALKAALVPVFWLLATLDARACENAMIGGLDRGAPLDVAIATAVGLAFCAPVAVAWSTALGPPTLSIWRWILRTIIVVPAAIATGRLALRLDGLAFIVGVAANGLCLLLLMTRVATSEAPQRDRRSRLVLLVWIGQGASVLTLTLTEEQVPANWPAAVVAQLAFAIVIPLVAIDLLPRLAWGRAPDSRSICDAVTSPDERRAA